MTQPVTRDLLATAVGRWDLDRPATAVRFSHKTMWGLVTVRGTFSGVSADGQVGPDGSVTGTLTVAAASIDTNHGKRDTHLRSPDFLDAVKYPAITLRVLSATVQPEGAQLQAQLTVKGVTEPITLLARVRHLTADSITVTVDTTLDRQRFGMSWNQLGMLRGLTSVTVDATFHRAG